MQEVKVIGSLESKFESTNRIYDVGGCSPTLNTMQGGNREPKVIVENQVPCKLDKMPDGYLDSLDNGIAANLVAGTHGYANSHTATQYRIRKLTPRECGRLMGVSDEDISKMAAVNSNTQLYKQFGNSIVVDVMCAMFKNLNIEQVSETRN